VSRRRPIVIPYTTAHFAGSIPVGSTSLCLVDIRPCRWPCARRGVGAAGRIRSGERGSFAGAFPAGCCFCRISCPGRVEWPENLWRRIARQISPCPPGPRPETPHIAFASAYPGWLRTVFNGRGRGGNGVGAIVIMTLRDRGDHTVPAGGPPRRTGPRNLGGTGGWYPVVLEPSQMVGNAAGGCRRGALFPLSGVPPLGKGKVRAWFPAPVGRWVPSVPSGDLSDFYGTAIGWSRRGKERRWSEGRERGGECHACCISAGDGT
jgi:hypothetical protein